MPLIRTRQALLATLALAVVLAGCAAVKSEAPAGLRIAKTWFFGAANKAEAEAIWGASALERTGALDDALSAFKNASDDTGITILKPNAGLKLAGQLETTLAEESDDVVVLMGHRDKAGLLRMQDGSSIALEGIGGRTKGARVVVISCDSARLCAGPLSAGIPASLTPDLAMRTYKLLPNYLAVLPQNPSGLHLQIALEAAFGQALTEAAVNKGSVTLTVITGLGATGAGIAISTTSS